MIETKTKYNLIATRVPPGDNWRLVEEYALEDVVYPSITETLEAFYTHMGIDCSYKLDPLDSKLYYISEEQIEVEEKPQKYSIYGDFKQGI